MPKRTRCFFAVAAGLVTVAAASAQPTAVAGTAKSTAGTRDMLTDAAVRGWFSGMASRRPLASRPEVEAVRNLKGEVLGWIFRTDRIEPVVRGKRGEIGVWVALGSGGKIRGVKVGPHREDKPWFDRIKEPFYKAFENRSADGSGGRPDAVTTATISSRAMIEDVFGACRVVLDLPEVRGGGGGGGGHAAPPPRK